MTFNPFGSNPSPRTGGDHKKRAFLVGNSGGQVYFLAKLALYRGQSINCYHLVTGARRKYEGRSTPNFDAIRDEILKNGIEVAYPSDIPEDDVERWVDFGKKAAKDHGLEVRE